MSNDACTKAPEAVVGPDQEAWVKDRIEAAVRMSAAVRAVARVGAEQGMVDAALDAVADAAAVEIIRTLGLEPGFVNLRRGR